MRRLTNTFAALFLTFSLIAAMNVFANVFNGVDKTSISNYPRDPKVKAASVSYEMAPVPQVAYSSPTSTVINKNSIYTNNDMLQGFLAWKDSALNQVQKVEVIPQTYFDEDAQFKKKFNVKESGLVEGDLAIGGRIYVDDDATVGGKLTVDSEQIEVNGVKYYFPEEQAAGNGYVLANDGDGELAWINQNEIFPGISGTDNRLSRFNDTGDGLEDSSINDLYSGGVAMTIDSDGGVAIGINSTSYNFEVSGSSNFSSFYLNGSQVTATASEINSLSGFSAEDGGVTFGNGTSLASDAVNFYWDDTNNRLGLGTNTPAYMLDVNGGIHTTDDVYVGSIALSGTGSSALDSGSTLIGVFDEFNNSNGTTIQQVLNDLDASITTFSAGAGDIESVGSMMAGNTFGDATADDQWLGLGATAGRIEFDDQATDEVNILNARLGVGTTGPSRTLDVAGTGKFSGELTATSGVNIGPDQDANLISTAAVGGASTTLYIGNESILVSGDIGSSIQAFDTGLASIAGLTTSANQMIYTTGSDAYATTSLTAFVRNLLDDNDAATARTTLGVAIGSNVQAWDADLDTLAGLSNADGNFIVGNGSAWTVESGNTARTSLGVGTGDSPQFTNLTLTGTTGATLSGAGAGVTFSSSGNHDVSASSGTLRVGAATLIGAITGNNQNITGVGSFSSSMATIGSSYIGSGISAASNGLLVQGNTGIGATNPSNVLVVQRDQAYTGTVPSMTQVQVRNDNSSGFAAFSLWSGTERGRMQYNAATPNIFFTTFGTVPFYIGTNDTVRMALDSNSYNVGFGGETSPAAIVHIKQPTTSTSGSALRVNRDNAAASTDSPLANFIQDNTGDDQTLIRGQQDGTGNLMSLLDGTTEAFTILDGGRVGIGTSAPRSLLSVSGGTQIGSGYTAVGISAPTNGLLVQGNVGIGSTNPGGFALNVAGTQLATGKITAASGINIGADQTQNLISTASAGASSTQLFIGNESILASGDIGSSIQAFDAGLASIAGLTTSANQMIYTTGSDTYTTTSLSAFGRTLIDDADAATARTTLGIGSGGAGDIWVDTAGDTMSGDLTINGGNLSLGNGTSNIIDWSTSGVAAPTFTSRSAGTKLVLYPAVSASAVDYALGIQSSSMWLSVPNSTSVFRFYGGTNEIANLTGAGNFNVDGTVTAADFSCTDCLDAANIATGAVTTTEILDGTIAAGDIGADAIGDSELFNGGTWNLTSGLTITGAKVGIGTAASTTTGLTISSSTGRGIYISASAGDPGIESQVSGATSAVYGINNTSTGGAIRGSSSSGYAFYGVSGGSVNTGYFQNSNTGIGVDIDSVANYALQATRSQATSIVARFENSSSYCQVVPGGTGFTCPSDIRLKKDVTTLSDSLNKVLSLRPVTYRWKTDSESDPLELGFVAQEVQKIVPELIYTDPDTGTLSMGYGNLTPLLVNAMQEQQIQIDKIINSTTGSTSREDIFATRLDNVESTQQAQQKSIDGILAQLTKLGSIQNSISALNEKINTLVSRLDKWDSVMAFVKGTGDSIASLIFKAPTVFSQMAFFDAPIKVSADTSEMVEIPSGTLKAKIKFDKSFPENPVIYLNFVNAVPIAHKIEDITKDGFTITFSDAPEKDIKIQWLALLRDSSQDGPSIEVIESQEHAVTITNNSEEADSDSEGVEIVEPTENFSSVSEATSSAVVVPQTESLGIIADSGSSDFSGFDISVPVVDDINESTDSAGISN